MRLPVPLYNAPRNALNRAPHGGFVHVDTPQGICFGSAPFRAPRGRRRAPAALINQRITAFYRLEAKGPALSRHLLTVPLSICLAFCLFGCPKVGSQPSPGVVAPTALSAPPAAPVPAPAQPSTTRETVVPVANETPAAIPEQTTAPVPPPAEPEPAPLQDPEDELSRRFVEAQSLFAEQKFQEARDALIQLTQEAPAFAKYAQARAQLALTHAQLNENQEAVQVASAVFENLAADMRHQIAPLFAPLAEENEQFAAAARFHAELVDMAETPQERADRLAVLTRIVETRLTANEIALIAQALPSQNAAWPLFQFKWALLQGHLGAHAMKRESLELLQREIPDNPFADAIRQEIESTAADAISVRPKTIGALLPLTGRYAAFGKTAQLGLELALRNSKISLVVKDTAGDPLRARQAVQELVEREGAIAIIGPVLSTEAPFAAIEAERMGIPLISLTANEDLPRFGDFIFRNMLTRGAQAKALADYAVGTLGYKSFAVLYPDFAYGSDLAHAFWDEIEQRGGQMHAAESYTVDQTTFRDQARKLVGRYYLDEREEFVKGKKEIDEMKASDFHKRKLREDLLKKLEPIIDFEALLIPDTYQRVSLVAPALAVEDIITNACDTRDLERIAETAGKKPEEIKTVLLLGTDAWNFPQIVERGGKFVQCAVFVDGFYANADFEATRTFVSEWENATQGKMPPLLLGAVSYDSARILRDIIERKKPMARAAMRSELLKTKDFPGACGPTGFDENGEVVRPLFLLTIDKEGIRELSSESQKE